MEIPSLRQLWKFPDPVKENLLEGVCIPDSGRGARNIAHGLRLPRDETARQRAWEAEPKFCCSLESPGPLGPPFLSNLR